MFDIGWQELFIVAILALLIVGPKDMPKALRTVTMWIRKLKSMAGEFQSGVNDMVREAELDDMRKEINQGVLEAEKQIKSEVDVDDMAKEMDDAMDSALDAGDVEKSFETLDAPADTADAGGDEDKKADNA